MALSPGQSLPVALRDESCVGAARREARRSAAEAALDEVAAERVSIAVTEAARNAIHHGGGGELLLRRVESNGSTGLEVLVLDRGGGIPNVQAAMRDGYSTAGTAGHGLGALSRVASTFDVWSAPGKGTAVLMRIWPGRPPPAPHVGVVCVPAPGERLAGDGWAAKEGDACMALLLADGLGHGDRAAEAAQGAVRTFAASRALTPAQILADVHAALRPTRGAAVAIASRSPDGTLSYAGVGNISGTLVGSDSSVLRRLVSLAGTAGLETRRIQEFSYKWDPEALLVMHSDGIATHWNLADYPGLARRDPALVAGVLYRDFSRGRDDATVLVARRQS